MKKFNLMLSCLFLALFLISCNESMQEKECYKKNKSSFGKGNRDIFVKDDYAYVIDDYNGLEIYDLNNPDNPTLKGSVATLSNANKVWVSNNYAYVVDIQYGLLIIDVKDPAKPTIKGNFDTPGFAKGIFMSENLVYVTDADILYNGGPVKGMGLLILDVADPLKPVFKGSIDTPGDAQDVFVSGNYAYVADNENGLTIIDIKNPANPVIIGSLDTPGEAQDIFVLENYAYLADSDSLYGNVSGLGLIIIDVQDPSKPVFKGNINTPGNAVAVSVSGNFAYIADNDISKPGKTIHGLGLAIIDVTDSREPLLKGAISSLGNISEIYLNNTFVFLANIYSGIQIIDISACNTPEN